MSTDDAAKLWRARYDEHRPVDGVCPVCGVPKCRVRADAFTDLIVTDRFLEGSTDDRPHETAGGARRTA